MVGDKSIFQFTGRINQEKRIGGIGFYGNVGCIQRYDVVYLVQNRVGIFIGGVVVGIYKRVLQKCFGGIRPKKLHGIIALP